MTKTDTVVQYFGQPVRVACDGKCTKAWGISNRPKVQLSDDEDDYAFLTDGELDDAPADPGTYEGGQGKPSSDLYFPNKWCVRECERCSMSEPGMYALPLETKSFDRRHYNMHWRDRERDAEVADGAD